MKVTDNQKVKVSEIFRTTMHDNNGKAADSITGKPKTKIISAKLRKWRCLFRRDSESVVKVENYKNAEKRIRKWKWNIQKNNAGQ